MRRLLIACLLIFPLAADEHWVQLHSGPSELFTNAGVKQARDTLMQFEQFRYVLGQILGNPALDSETPLRILLFKSAKEAAIYPSPSPVVKGRDRYNILAIAATPIPGEVFRECTRILLQTGTARMPPAIERGLADLFSTIEISTVHVSLGRPVTNATRNRDWARIHLLVTSPDYYGKLRVLLFNLQKGVDEDAAYRNSLGKSRAEVEKELDQYIAAAHFPPVPISGRPVIVEREFQDKPLAANAVRLALADLMLGSTYRDAYRAMIQDKVNLAESYEGLGLIALRDKQTDEAQQNFSKAMEAGAQTPDPYIEYARLEADAQKAKAALAQALKLNPKQAAPYFLMAQRETDSARRIQYLQKAASLAPRGVSYWQALAEAHIAQKQFSEAAKAWRSAEQAAVTEEERARMRVARLAIEEQRLDYEAAERKRIVEEKEREIRKLKNAALADLRAAEAKANRANGSAEPPPEKVVPWWDGPQPSGRVAGILKRVDCTGAHARLALESDDHKMISLLVRDPGKIAIIGSDQQTLGCGIQKPRHVIVEYFPLAAANAPSKSPSKSAAAGEVATIEFR